MGNLHGVHNKAGWSFRKIMRYINKIIITCSPISFPFFNNFLLIDQKKKKKTTGYVFAKRLKNTCDEHKWVGGYNFNTFMDLGSNDAFLWKSKKFQSVM